jgi:AcrR family transcriptional regulator
MNMCSVTFKKLRHDASAQILVDAAEAVLMAKGLGKVTMRDIAAQAGCAAGTIYLYFKTKQDVIGAIAARHSDALLARLEARWDEPVPPLEQLRLVTRDLVEYFNHHRGIIRILHMGGVGGLPSLPPELQETWAEFMRHEIEVIRAAQKDGSVRRDFPPELIQKFMYLVIVGLHGDVMHDQELPAPEVQERMIWTLMTGGIGDVKEKRHAKA